MARPEYPSDKLDQYMLRLPDGMRDRLKEAAGLNQRSLNAEIVARLTWTLGPSDDYIGELLEKLEAQRQLAAEAMRLEKHWKSELERLRTEVDELRISNASMETELNRIQKRDKVGTLEEKIDKLLNLYEDTKPLRQSVNEIEEIVRFMKTDTMLWKDKGIYRDIHAVPPELETALALELAKAIDDRTVAACEAIARLVDVLLDEDVPRILKAG